jgi:hypothetical protein
MCRYDLPTAILPNPGICPSKLEAVILTLILSFYGHTICDNRRISIDSNLKLIGYDGGGRVLARLHVRNVLCFGNKVSLVRRHEVLSCLNPIKDRGVPTDPGIIPLILQPYQLLFHALALCLS